MVTQQGPRGHTRRPMHLCLLMGECTVETPIRPVQWSPTLQLADLLIVKLARFSCPAAQVFCHDLHLVSAIQRVWEYCLDFDPLSRDGAGGHRLPAIVNQVPSVVCSLCNLAVLCGLSYRYPSLSELGGPPLDGGQEEEEGEAGHHCGSTGQGWTGHTAITNPFIALGSNILGIPFCALVRPQTTLYGRRGENVNTRIIVGNNLNKDDQRQVVFKFLFIFYTNCSK